MDEQKKDINIALLIDVDNVGWRYIESILSELSKYGKVTIRRMYGDFSQNRLKGWLTVASRYSLTPIMQPNNTPGKNASDIGLIIDAMDILYSGEVEGFCIVSSDGDFNKLATRIREAGKIVIGMGESKTPESFRASCERFIFLDVDDDDDVAETAPVPNTAAAAAGQDSVDITRAAIENTIIKMVSDNDADGQETDLSEISNRLVKIYPDFDIRSYGFSKLSSFLKDFKSLKVETRGNIAYVSLRESSLKDIEDKIASIFRKTQQMSMNVGQLKNELAALEPNLNATIKKNGVTKFSVFLDRCISCIRVEKDGTKAVFVKKN